MSAEVHREVLRRLQDELLSKQTRIAELEAENRALSKYINELLGFKDVRETLRLKQRVNKLEDTLHDIKDKALNNGEAWCAEHAQKAVEGKADE